MKKILVGLMIVAMGLLLMSPVASAYPVAVGDSIIIGYGTGNANNGGSFKISEAATPTNILFETFCLERNEYFYPNPPYSNSYWIGSITGGAMNGGYSGQETTNYDPLSSAAAYLYSRWSTGAIDKTTDNANALQLAIWTLEGEWTTALTGKSLDFYNEASAETINANGYLYGVQVMNLFTTKGSCSTNGGTCYTGVAQDQLVWNQVPEPASMLLFGLGLLGLAGLRRRFKK